MQAVGLSPRVGLTAIAVVLVVGLGVALGTGDRAAQVGAGVDRAFGDLGFRVNAVHLQGAQKSTQSAILKAANLAPGQPILGLDLNALRARVEHVGWVRRVRVIRLLPDTLVIAVDERRMLAVWQHAGHTQVIDADGQVVREADPGRFSNLPLIVGQGADAAAASILPAIAQRPRLSARLEALVRVDDRRWDLRLKDGGVIQLPASDEEAALIRLDQLDEKSRLLELGFARVDLRDPDMVAVRPRQTAAPVLGQVGFR